MRYTSEQADETRARVLDAAGRAFRQRGFGGVGVDGLAKAAGVTSGAIYGHFRSKSGTFRAAAIAGLDRLRLAVETFRAGYGAGWVNAFAAYYLGKAHREDVAGGCALPSLSADVGREANETRADYQRELLRVAETVAAGDGLNGDRRTAWPLLAQLAGGVLLARAVEDEALAQEIADSVLAAVRAERG